MKFTQFPHSLSSAPIIPKSIFANLNIEDRALAIFCDLGSYEAVHPTKYKISVPFLATGILRPLVQLVRSADRRLNGFPYV
ncbi:MAG: hypothetical protein ACXAAT_20355 [Candidatus Hodarchaeales archaeon]